MKRYVGIQNPPQEVFGTYFGPRYHDTDSPQLNSTYWRGYRAAEAGKEARDNPYYSGGPFWYWWDDGYQDVRQAALRVAEEGEGLGPCVTHPMRVRKG